MNEEQGSDLDRQAGEMRAEIARWIADDARDADGEASGSLVDDELAIWLSLPASRRQEVRRRLSLLQGLRGEKVRGAATRVAAELGTGRANMYRIMGRMSDVGPVSGLDTQRRAPADAVAARDGFGPPLDDWLAELFEADPNVSLTAARLHLRERILREGPAGPRMPSQATVSRRLERLREEAAGSTFDEPVGARLLVDRCLLDVQVPAADSRGAPGRVSAVMAVDLDTRLICGVGVYVGDVVGGVRDMIADFGARTAGLAAAGCQFPTAMRELRWTVPRDLEDRAEAAGALLPASRRPWIALDVEATWGAQAISLLGDRLGGFRLHRSLGVLVVQNLRTQRTDLLVPSEADEAAVGPHMVGYSDLREAALAVGIEADRWNRSRAAALRVVGARGRARHASAAAKISRDLGLLFENVLPDHPEV